MSNIQQDFVYGGDLVLWISTTTGGTVYPMAYAKTAKMQITCEVKDITSKDSGYFKEKIASRMDWTMDSEGIVSFTATGNTNTIDDLYTAMQLRTPINVGFACKTGTYPSWTVDSTRRKFTGSALIASLDVNSTMDEVTWSVKLDGVGVLTMV